MTLLFQACLEILFLFLTLLLCDDLLRVSFDVMHDGWSVLPGAYCLYQLKTAWIDWLVRAFCTRDISIMKFISRSSVRGVCNQVVGALRPGF